jgi:hypothetical protein
MRTDRVIGRERTGTLWVEVIVAWFYAKMSGVKREAQRCAFVVHISLRALDYTQKTVHGYICWGCPYVPMQNLLGVVKSLL